MSDAASQLIVSSDRLQSVAPDLTTQLLNWQLSKWRDLTTRTVEVWKKEVEEMNRDMESYQ